MRSKKDLGAPLRDRLPGEEPEVWERSPAAGASVVLRSRGSHRITGKGTLREDHRKGHTFRRKESEIQIGEDQGMLVV